MNSKTLDQTCFVFKVKGILRSVSPLSFSCPVLKGTITTSSVAGGHHHFFVVLPEKKKPKMYLYIRNINSEKEKGNDNNDDNERKFQRILFPLENNKIEKKRKGGI